MILLLAPNGHAAAVARCPFLGPMQTWPECLPMSPFDPTETLAEPNENTPDTVFCSITVLVLAARMPS